jgi:hypothetical protein
LIQTRRGIQVAAITIKTNKTTIWFKFLFLKLSYIFRQEARGILKESSGTDKVLTINFQGPPKKVKKETKRRSYKQGKRMKRQMEKEEKNRRRKIETKKI